MGDAARALDDVSDHLGEVLRRADELLADWSRFGGEVRAQVEREAAAIGDVVDAAIARAAGAGVDRGIADRLRALTVDLERLELRMRAASRAAAEERHGDRRVLWLVVAGVVLANALLVAVLLRRPEALLPVAEPVRLEVPAPLSVDPAGSAASAGSAQAQSPAPDALSPGPNSGSASAANAKGSGGPGTGLVDAGAAKPASDAGTARPALSPIALPPHTGGPRPHRKLP